MKNLYKALKVNALFSSFSGVMMILFSNQIAKLFGTDKNSIFWIIGLVLIYFSITIWYEMSRQRKLAVLWIIIQDFIWVIGSLILILLNPFETTPLGSIITGIIGLIVLFMGINQSKALSRKDTTGTGRI